MPFGSPIYVIDSHAQGEPTRVVVSGGPDLGTGHIASLERFRKSFDHFRSAIVCEPWGSEGIAGALLLVLGNGDSRHSY
jgi:proline racemase